MNKTFGAIVCYLAVNHDWMNVGALERTCLRCDKKQRRLPLRNPDMTVYDFGEWYDYKKKY